MADLLRDLVGWLLIGGGGVFLMIGAIGLNRMPDVFTRMHATSVSDTFGASLMLAGMAVMAGFTLVTVKLLFLLLFLLFTGPVATHAVARAAVHAGLKPVLAEGSPVADPAADVDRAEGDGIDRDAPPGAGT